MEADIKSIIAGSVELPFNKYYDSSKSYFSSINHFQTLTAATCKGLQWSSKPGVYIIWRLANPEEVIYIGMTGKFTQAGEISVGQGLKGRMSRWVPYCFDTNKNEFCFGPKYRRGESRNEPPSEGYHHEIPVSNIRIECFEYDPKKKMAPAFLESLLLQGYLMQFNQLPIGNNEL